MEHFIDQAGVVKELFKILKSHLCIFPFAFPSADTQILESHIVDPVFPIDLLQTGGLHKQLIFANRQPVYFIEALIVQIPETIKRYLIIEFIEA